MKEKSRKKISFTFNGKDFLVDARVCKSLWSQGWGKMFSFSKEPIFFVFPEKREVDIHMLFVFTPLLVVWFDEKMNVVKAEKMKPFVSLGSAKAKYVLEIPLKK